MLCFGTQMEIDLYNPLLSIEDENAVKSVYENLLNRNCNTVSINKPRNAPCAGDIFSHYKNPNAKYLVIGLGFNTEYVWNKTLPNNEFVVVYMDLNGGNNMFCRPLNEWLENAVLSNGKTVTRFKFNGRFCKTFRPKDCWVEY